MFAMRVLNAGLLGVVLVGTVVFGSAPAVASRAESGSALARAAQSEASGVYTFDRAHSSINFSVSHMAISRVHGRFGEFSGSITFDADDVTKSQVEFTAKVASINTDVPPRDNHLRSADFFDVEKYPEMTFKSTKVERKGDAFVAHGDLTLHGVTKQISIPFTLGGPLKDQRGGHRIGVVASTTLNRQDYGISWSRTLDNGGLAVGNEVDVELALEAVKAPPKPSE